MELHGIIEFVYKHKKRKLGSGSVEHLHAVKDILKKAGVTDPEILNAALLHDVLEDTQMPKEYLTLKFGPRIADIVWVLSKNNPDEVVESPEAILIRMADQLHNLQTLHGLAKEKQQEYLKETEVLLPMCKRAMKEILVGEVRTCGTRLLRKLEKIIDGER